ncbi:T7SS effector LXG polymorphic toxin [Sporolactobacillus nakayamae]|uniref:LXG domain of WXG superfamily protein n=1 Tax=Sporolactobacillus nakayamae TaxID=269670 RepID=A0A1I2UH63_9BACL|nr:T7SS effector LXG polymorphic toxin [Sporolactobacillus nakayamae]SFG75719.1 LXG domain of WXG superfamily protein [Sporolactobacillus nakayamae]
MIINMVGSGSAGDTQTYDAESLITAAKAHAKHYQTLRDQFHTLRQAFQQISGLGPDFQGKGAEAIKRFYAAQVNVVDAWIRLIDKKIAYFQGISGTIQDKNLGGDTQIHIPFLNDDLSMGYARSKEMVREQRDDIAKILSSISDLVPINIFSNHDVDQELDTADKKRAKMVLDVQDLDQSLTNEYRQITEDLPHIQALYEELIHSTRQGANVQPMHFNADVYHHSNAYQLEEQRIKKDHLYLGLNAQQKEKLQMTVGTSSLIDRLTTKKLEPKLRLYVNKAKEDFKKGLISKKMLDSIMSGILNTGTAFIQNSIETKLTDEASKQIASSVITWIQKNTTHFVDRGLVGATISGGSTTIREAPTLLSSAIRTGATYGIPIVGSAIDFSVQMYRGEDAKDAAIKTGGHLGAGMVGAAIGSLVPAPGVGTVIGFAVGVAGSMAFDWVYDHKDEIAHQFIKIGEGAAHMEKSIVHSVMENHKEIGEAVSGFFGNLGSAFN